MKNRTKGKIGNGYKIDLPKGRTVTLSPIEDGKADWYVVFGRPELPKRGSTVTIKNAEGQTQTHISLSDNAIQALLKLYLAFKEKQL